MHNRIRTSPNFEYVTAIPTNSSMPSKSQTEKDPTDLKDLYNHLYNENKKKIIKLANLKRMIQDKKQSLYKISDAGLESNMSLAQKIHKREEICQDELVEQTVLLNKKKKLKIVSDQMRGKLTELQKDYEKITTNHSAFNNSNFASKYSLLISTKALEDYEKQVEEARKLFKTNSEKLENRFKSTSESNLRQNDRIKSVEMKIQAQKNKKKEFVKQYKMCLKDFKVTAQSRQASLNSLASYQEAFSLIRERIHKESPELQVFSDFSREVIEKLIEKFKELEFKSASLSLTYEKMSEDEANLNRELSTLKEELSTVKQFCDSSQNLPIENFRSLNDCKKSYEVEVGIVQIYFQTVEILYQGLEKLANAKGDGEFEEKLKMTLALLKSTRIGTQKRKPFNIDRFVIEKIVGKNTYFETRLETMNSIALNTHELQSIFSQVFENDPKTCKAFVKFVESSPIIKLFLDRDSLLSILTKNHKKSFFELLQDLGQTCATLLQDHFKALLIKTSEFLSSLKNILSPNPATLNVQNPLLAGRSRSQSIFPYKVTERSHKKGPEHTKHETRPPLRDPTPKKPATRLQSLSSTDITRQKVVKEVIENKKKESFLRTTEKKIARTSEKLIQLPYMRRFVLRPLTERLPNSLSSSHQNFCSL